MTIQYDNTGNLISTVGDATNISVSVQPKGTGSVNLATGSTGVNLSNGTTVTAITRTATGSGYTSIPTITIGAPQLPGGVQATATPIMLTTGQTIVSGGTGYTVGDTLTVSGGTFSSQVILTVASVSAGVITGVTVSTGGFGNYSVLPTNPVSVTGGTGTGATFNITWGITGNITITNAGSGYVEQPAVTFSGGGGSGAAAYATIGSSNLIRSIGSTFNFNTPGGTQLAVTDASNPTVYPYISGGAGSAAIGTLGASNGNLNLSPRGTGTFSVLTANFASEQFRVSPTTSAVNYVQVTGSATGSNTVISTQGSDASVSLNLAVKGTASTFTFLGNGGAYAIHEMHQQASSANRFRTTATATGVSPLFSAVGSDANIAVRLRTQGNGAFQFETGSSGNEQFRIINTTSAVNFVQVTGNSTGNPPIVAVQGSDTNIALVLASKGSGAIRLSSSGGTNTQLRIYGTNAAVNNLAITGTTAGSAPILSSEGSDTNIDLNLTTKGTGAVNLNTGNGTAFKAVDFVSATVNWVAARGSSTGSATVLYSAGADTDVNMVVGTKGAGILRFNTARDNAGSNGLDQFRITHTASAVNYLQVAGSATSQEPLLSAQGSDTDISIALQSKGTGSVNLATGSTGVNISNGTTVTALTRTGAGGGYTSAPTITIGAPQLPSGVQATATCSLGLIAFNLTSGGTGYTVGDTITLSGGTGTALAAFTVSTVSSGVITSITAVNAGAYSVAPTNPVSVTGGTGTGATVTVTSWGINSAFTITNAGSGYVEQPTVTFSGGGGSGAAAYATVGSGTAVRSLGSPLSFNMPSGEVFRISDSPSINGYWIASSNGTSPALRASTAANAQIHTTGSTSLLLGTSGGTTQLFVSHTASAVNYVQVTGAATGNRPVISAQGSDTNIGISFTAKGTGIHAFNNGNGTQLVLQTGPASSVNRIEITPSVTGVAPSIASGGTDTNIDLNLTTKGTGAINASTGSATPTLLKVQEDTSGTPLSSTLWVTGAKSTFGRVNLKSSNALHFSTNATNAMGFFTNSTSTVGSEGSQQFAITNTTSSVNWVQVTGAATGGRPAISAQGSDTNVGITYTAKGTGIHFFTGNAGNQFAIQSTASAVNYISASGAAAGSSPAFSSVGSDTDIDLNLTPKGAGLVRFGTYTATVSTITGYIEIKDSTGTIRRLAVVS